MAIRKVDLSEDVVMYHGDCLEVMPGLGKVDAVVTDPPYGVGYKYDSHDDKREGYQEWCQEWFAILRDKAEGPIAISCGTVNLCDWPQPSWVMCWHKPACMGRSPIGFNNWEPILVYGKTRGPQTTDVVRATIIPDKDIDWHPCPKPLGWAIGIIEKLTRTNDTVLDCFAGSGTTGAACVRTNRRFIGIEKDEKYFNLACQRIAKELDDRRNNLFAEIEPVVMESANLF